MDQTTINQLIEMEIVVSCSPNINIYKYCTSRNLKFAVGHTVSLIKFQLRVKSKLRTSTLEEEYEESELYDS